MQNLCDLGANVLTGCRSDGSFRMSIDGKPIGQGAGISTFCERHRRRRGSRREGRQGHARSTRPCLVGCGVGTGWGSAVNAAEVKPGDTMIIMGIGGIGINAVQGARHAGATNVIAVDPVEFKREKAQEMGATHTFATMDEAAEFARSVTNGQGADSAIVTVGVLKTEHVAPGVRGDPQGRHGGGDRHRPTHEQVAACPPFELTLFQKRIQGALFGASSPSRDIPLDAARCTRRAS